MDKSFNDIGKSSKRAGNEVGFFGGIVEGLKEKVGGIALGFIKAEGVIKLASLAVQSMTKIMTI
jgi:hypothetical protein